MQTPVASPQEREKWKKMGFETNQLQYKDQRQDPYIVQHLESLSGGSHSHYKVSPQIIFYNHHPTIYR
jgi:hypothetical protein